MEIQKVRRCQEEQQQKKKKLRINERKAAICSSGSVVNSLWRRKKMYTAEAFSVPSCAVCRHHNRVGARLAWLRKGKKSRVCGPNNGDFFSGVYYSKELLPQECGKLLRNREIYTGTWDEFRLGLSRLRRNDTVVQHELL